MLPILIADKIPLVLALSFTINFQNFILLLPSSTSPNFFKSLALPESGTMTPLTGFTVLILLATVERRVWGPVKLRLGRWVVGQG